MKVVLYMAITANGMIAREDGSTPWFDSEWESYSSFVKKCGNLIVGRKTFEVMIRQNEFSNLGDPLVVVLTNEKIKSEKRNVFFTNNPSEAIEIVKKRGLKEALVGGGSKINSLFMKKCLVDEIYLDVEPLVFGKGVKIFADADFEAKLELLETKMLSKNEIQLHYKVKK